MRSGRLRVRLRVRPEAAPQTGPARILTLSRDNVLRNLTIGQEGHDLVVRLRRSDTTLNGTPPFPVAGVLDGAWRDVEVTIEPRRLWVFVDGAEALAADLDANALAAWDPGFRLALGNEFSGLRPWRGEIALARVEAGGATEVDLLAPGALEVPAGFWAAHQWPRWPFADWAPHLRTLEDRLANFVAFVPLGFLLAMLGTRGRRRRPAVHAVLVASLASLLVEVAQLFFDTHFPSTTDWVLNTLGAAAGAFAARTATRWWLRRPVELLPLRAGG
jgi:VanZ family protein